MGQDNRVEMASNQVTFIIGTTMAYSGDTIMEVKAPMGFKFNYDCTRDIGEAYWAGTGMLTIPQVESCMNQEKSMKREANKAHVFLKGAWKLGSYGIFVKVHNPMFTPLRNFWGFTIFDRVMEPLMSEAWVYGFKIQVILPDYYPGLIAYNSGLTDLSIGEAAMNILDLSFTLTTPLDKGGHFFATAPLGFRFPSVCRQFHPCLNCAKSTGHGVVPGSQPLSPFTQCLGREQSTMCPFGPCVQLYDLNMQWQAGVMYSFRILIVNPREKFKETNVAERWWRYETRGENGEMQDLHRVIPSFPIYQRLRYFVVDTLSRVGLGTTTLRLHFASSSPIPPQQTVIVTPPEGMAFYGVRSNNQDGACINEDPVIISRQFPTPLISGVTRLPEWISCIVESPTRLVLKNEESILGGRPLISGPVYEVFVRNVTNPQSTPYLNYFRAVAKTSDTLGEEHWASEGFVIFPELEDLSVTSSNEAFGLYSIYDIRMTVITEVPSGGSILITAPSDYYFGPVIVTPTTINDPLNPLPPPSGVSPPRPPRNQITVVDLNRTKAWADGEYKCPFDFQPCIDIERPPCYMADPLPAECTTKQNLCIKWNQRCQEGSLNRFMRSVSFGSNLELTFQPEVSLPARKHFHFRVMGYNTRYASENRDAPNGGGNWDFVTRNSDSEKTILDKKSGVPGVQLMGVIFMDSLIPTDTKIGVVENRVKITLRLAVAVPAKAKLKITHPLAFMRNANAAFEGALITLGVNFPRSVEKLTQQNHIILEAPDEALPANVPLLIDVGITNPDQSPASTDNIWQFEASSFATGKWVQLNCNRNASGFKIFGQMGSAQITASVLSPTANTIIGVWFVLKSVLKYSDTSRMKIWMPVGWKPLHQCGTGHEIYPFSRTYNPNREGVKNSFPSTMTFFEIPSGTDCYDYFDADSGQYYIELEFRGGLAVDYGLDYAFEFGATNPRYTPPAADNMWRFETLRNGVILHLRQNIVGFTLEEIKEIHVRPSDTTTLAPQNRIEFYMMSDKYIPGGSKIIIRAPNGFIFTCAFFRTDEGLSNTTTCYVRERNLAEFTIDSQDPKQPQTPFRLFVNLFNPEFTPQENHWSFEIISPLGQSIDIRDNVHGFDITGRVQVEVLPLFPYLGQNNPLRVRFVPSTIMNQADEGNELVLTAPSSYLFNKNCTGFYLRFSVTPDIPEDVGGYPSSFEFPPPGIQCIGFDNSTVVIRMPTSEGLSNQHTGGLLKNNYTLEIDVLNPVNHSASNTWTFVTRVRNPSGQRIVDANRTLEGFSLNQLVPLNLDESFAARRLSHPCSGTALVLALLLLVQAVSGS